MIGLHKTADGEQVPFAAMSDEHLVNLINKFLSPLDKRLRYALKKEEIDEFAAALYINGTLDARSLMREIQEKITLMLPAIAEIAVFRDEATLNEIKPMLCRLLRRSGGLFSDDRLMLKDGKIIKGGDASYPE